MSFRKQDMLTLPAEFGTNARGLQTLFVEGDWWATGLEGIVQCTNSNLSIVSGSGANRNQTTGINTMSLQGEHFDKLTPVAFVEQRELVRAR